MNRLRAAFLTTLLASALLLVASTASAQMTGDTPSNGDAVTYDAMAAPATSFSADATISTGTSNRFETPGYERPMNRTSVSWRVLPAEERFSLLRLVVASMWRWPGL